MHAYCTIPFHCQVLPTESNVEEGPAQAPNSITLNLGLIHRMFAKCLPANTAIFLFILVTFILSGSDGGSDIALGYFLYSR